MAFQPRPAQSGLRQEEVKGALFAAQAPGLRFPRSPLRGGPQPLGSLSPRRDP